MTDTNRNGTSTLHHRSDTPVNLDSNSGSRDPARNEPAVEKRTRSQHNVSNLILRLPLSRSPFKDARKAQVKARGTSPPSHADLQLRGMDHGVMGGTNGATETKAVHKVEEGRGMDTCADERTQQSWGSQDSLFSLSGDCGGDHGDNSSQHTIQSTTTGKRASPDTDAMGSLSGPGGERHSKRAKVDGLEGFRFLDRKRDHSEHHEPLRDSGVHTSSQPRGHKRALSMKQTPSPTKGASSIFLRAQSVPLGGANAVREIDFTTIPPSPRRSPSKGVVEIRRALSVPPVDDDQMDVDSREDPALLHFTNPTTFSIPRATPVFHYTVNFATPRGAVTPSHSGHCSASPLSPLTPVPLSPRSEILPGIQSLLTKPPLVPPLTSGSSTGSIMVEGSSKAGDISSNKANGTGGPFTYDSELSSPLSSPSDSNASPVSCPIGVDILQHKRGPIVVQGSRRLTRSVSMRVEGTKASAMSEPVAISTPSVKMASKPRPPKSTGTMTSKPKPMPPARRSTSVSKPSHDLNKFRQTSLNAFVKEKPPVENNDSIVRTKNEGSSSSRLAPPSSPSKIPLPVSASKRHPRIQPGSKPFLFSLGSPNTSTGTACATSGRSLTTLSHALDKLIVPAPRRPNTSMGFVREDENSEEGSIDDIKGKGKAKDDASVPLASARPASRFARPTASSLSRAATVTELASTASTKIRDRGRAIMRGRGTIGIFGRAGDRASKKTSLPVVAGSPVKGSGGLDGLDRDASGTDEHRPASTFVNPEGIGALAGTDNVFLATSAVRCDKAEQDTISQVTSASTYGEENTAQKLSLLPAANAGVDIDLTTPISSDKGKQRAVPPSTLNPASSALHALSESLSSLPQTPTPPKPKVVGTRTGLRSSTTTAGKESPVLDGSSSAGPSGNSEVHGSGGADPSSATADGVKKPSLKILKRCAIFVDVRTEQGDDAGSLFVDMLKGLGAKIMGRLGRKCTHIVYKNGLPATLTRYRMLDEPKPVVVGIAWVVECVEKRAKVDEEKFKIDVDVINVAGSNHKRRRSMLPKHLIPASPGPESDVSMHVSSEADDDDGGGGIDGLPAQDPDVSTRSREEDDLPPLERARRRRSVLPGGQTRLVP